MKLSSARDSYPPGWRIQRRSISSGTGLPWLVHWLSSKQFSSNQLYQAGQGQVTSREVARITFHTNQYFVFWPGTRYSNCEISTICSSICPAQGTQSSCRVVFRNQIISGDKSLFSVSRVILLLIYRREEGWEMVSVVGVRFTLLPHYQAQTRDTIVSGQSSQPTFQSYQHCRSGGR